MRARREASHRGVRCNKSFIDRMRAIERNRSSLRRISCFVRALREMRACAVSRA
jgi:hypothetical protein